MASVWEVHVRRHNHRVILSLLAMGVRIDRAQELAQLAWIKLIERDRDGKLERLELPGLAVAQARFFALDLLRTERLERHRMAPLSECIADLARDPEQHVAAIEALEHVDRALSECSSSARQIFRLLAEDPSTPHAEVAAKVGLSTQRVRQIICEVRKRLRVAFRESEQ